MIRENVTNHLAEYHHSEFRRFFKIPAEETKRDLTMTALKRVPVQRVSFSLFVLLAVPALGQDRDADHDAVLADEWPQWPGPNREPVWHASGIVDTFPKDGPPLRWKTPIGSGYSGPAVTGGRVFVMDRIMQLDGKTHRES